MGLRQTSFYSGISTAVSLIAGLVTNKVASVFLGTSGMFLLGQLKDFVKLANISGNLGTSNGIIKYVAQYKSKPSIYDSFLATGFKTHVYSSLLVCVITLLFKDSIANYFFKDLKFSMPLVILSISFITISLHSFVMSVINGLKQIRLYITINIIATLVTAAIMVGFVIEFNIIGAFYAIAINQIITFLISLIFIVIYKSIDFKILFSRFRKKHFKNLTKFTVMALMGPICLIGATFFVRLFLADKLGQNYAGSWEGMWRLSNIYILFLTTTFQFYLIPTFSTISGSALKKEIFKVWTLSVPIIIAITISVYVMKDFLISFLFSKEFLLMNSILLFHLLGDAIKINTWVLGNVLIAKAKTMVFVYFQVGWAIAFSFLTYFLVNKLGFNGVSIAYFITYVAHFIAMNFYFRKLLWVRD